MREAVTRCITFHVAAYGEEFVKPKHHWCYDIAEQLERDQDVQVLLDAFVVERLHLRFRDLADRITNPTRIEPTLLTLAIMQQKSS